MSARFRGHLRPESLGGAGVFRQKGRNPEGTGLEQWRGRPQGRRQGREAAGGGDVKDTGKQAGLSWPGFVGREEPVRWQGAPGGVSEERNNRTGFVLLLGLPWRQWRRRLETGRESRHRERSDCGRLWEPLLRQQTQAGETSPGRAREAACGDRSWREKNRARRSPRVGPAWEPTGAAAQTAPPSSRLSQPPRRGAQGSSPTQPPARKPRSQTWLPGEPKTAGQDYMSVHTPFLNS